MNLADLALTV